MEEARGQGGYGVYISWTLGAATLAPHQLPQHGYF